MRITKKMLREAKGAMRHRISELMAIYAAGKIRDELQRVFPIYLSNPTPQRDEECLRQLLCLLLDDAIPAHWDT